MEILHSKRLLISPDALALVRFGLRDANDPRMLGTVKAIDALLRRELPNGPYWYRYNNDGYGEHADGSPFDGTGIGRLWPLLTGERAHYELAAGRLAEAKRLLNALEGSAGTGGLLPEQIWDSEEFPDRNSFSGGLPGVPCRWSGPMGNISSCCDRSAITRSSICRRKRFSRYVNNKPAPAPIVWQVASKVAAHRRGPGLASGISGCGADPLVDG